MTTKLTLSIEKDLIDKAKSYAKKKGRSLSDIVESYFRVIIEEKKKPVIDSTPITSSLRGSFDAPKGYIDYKKQLSKALSKKHL